MSLALEVSSLTKTYPGKPPVQAVRGVDLQVRHGQCYGFLGPNGAGKTTTIEILEGLIQPTSGKVRVLDMDWKSHAAAIRERIGVSLQETEMSDKLSVAETVDLFRSFYSNGLTTQRAIELVGLQEKEQAWIKHLSGGQKQRLAVACAIVGDPDLLFLDEPTTGLDPASRRQLWDIIGRFRENGRTILLTTHYMDEAERLCDRVAIIDQGKIIAEDTPARLIAGIGAEHVIEIQLDPADKIDQQLVEDLPTVSRVERDRCGFKIAVGQPHKVLPALIGLTADHRVDLTELATRHVTLEDVFLDLTGRHLIEDDDGHDANSPEIGVTSEV